MIDYLDRQIVSYMCNGVYSYNELAKLCNAGRNTVYRRIGKLEKEGIIRKRIMVIPNFDKLDLSAIVIGANVNIEETEKTIAFLKTQINVKFLWKTYGTHDIVFTMLCNKNDVGKCIYKLRTELAKLKINITKFDTSGSVSWEKIDLNPTCNDQSFQNSK
ncbi:MAG: Lrp/AsnC family transcriptional regulator [Candidatus Bathyarchaeia archaeon]|jgi:DNA-binding Lrp family transcriptional regulator